MAIRDLAHYYRVEGWLGNPFLYLKETPSTNDVARRRALEGVDEGLVVLAESQSAGRGRLQRRWLTPAGSSLLFSLLFRPPEPFAYHAARTSMICGLALLDAVAEVTELASCALKWPNDLIVEPDGTWRKVAGMLSEIVLDDGAPAALVVGIGLNVNVPQEALSSLGPNAGSLSVEAGRSVDRLPILERFLSGAERMVKQLRGGWDPLPAWRARLAWQGERVAVRTPTVTLCGVMDDVDEDGALLLRTDDGALQRFSVGDVSLRIC
ncbi:MAG: biotin--[acetyl-CoA-carboxylase] ligase [Anaerolineales bacterium]